MDDSEVKSIKKIHDYMTECLNKPFNGNNSIELCENDIPSIYSSLKNYILRLTNINNFMRCENYVLKKKNEDLIKNAKEPNISYMGKKNIHDIYINKINKLNNENDFIKYKFQKILRKNLSLERNNIELNRNLLNKDNYTQIENNKKRVKPDTEEKNITEDIPNHLYEHTKCDNSIIFNNEIYLNDINPFSLEKEIKKIIECTNILQDMLNLLNHNLKYDDPITFSATLKKMNMEKEELMEHNSYLKNKILQIETFILNDPFLVEKFNNLYNMVNIDFDKSIKDNIKLYENHNTRILFKRLCSLENTNTNIKNELIYQNKQLDMYKMHISDIKNLIKKKLNNFYTLNYHQNIVFNALNKFNNTNFSFNDLNYFNSCENDEKFIHNPSIIKDKFNCTNNLSTTKNSDPFTIFQINNNKTDQNHKLLNEAWERISQLDQDVCYFKEKKNEKKQHEGGKDISGKEYDCIVNELYYIKIKELINKRKIELNNFINGELSEIKYAQNDASKINQCKLDGYKLNNYNLNLDLNEYPNYENNYINSKILLKYMKYKQAYNFYMQNKNIYKKNVSKAKFNNFLNKYIFNEEHNKSLNYNNDIKISGAKKTFFELFQNKKMGKHKKKIIIPPKKKSDEQRESVYVEIENTEYDENQTKLSQESNSLISKKSDDNSRMADTTEYVKKDVENEEKKNDSCEKNEDSSISLSNLKNNDTNSENFDSHLEYPKRQDLSLEILRTNINNLAKKKTIANTNSEHIENDTYKRDNSKMVGSYEINKDISLSSINSNKNSNTSKEELYKNMIDHEKLQNSIEFESTNESEKLTNVKEENTNSDNDLKKEISIHENKYDSTDVKFDQNLKHRKSSIYVKKKTDYDIEVKQIINELSGEFDSDELNKSKESEEKENTFSIKNKLDSPILVKDDQEDYPKFPKKVSFSSSTKSDATDIHEENIEDSNSVIKKVNTTKNDSFESYGNKKGEPSVEKIEKTEIKEANSYENSPQINNIEKRKPSDMWGTDNFDLKRSISGYSDPDLFDNKKYSNIKIELFRDIIYKYDKNLYEFFMKLILHSNTDLVGTYKNQIFNAQIASGNVLDYIVSNYTKNENWDNNRNSKIEETEKVIDLLGKNDCKIITEYICNNGTSTSLRTLYHKVDFITKENYKEFKDRLLEYGVINLINLFLDEDINHFDKIFSVSFVNFGDALGISGDVCMSHFNNMDKKHNEKGYIYLKHIFDYLNIENEIKEEYHKYNFISVKNKNYIYININENYSNLYEFFNSITKKNNLYITLNEFIYFFSQNDNLKKYNLTQKDVIELYYSILFYAYYSNKNKNLLNILQSSDNSKNDGINIVDNINSVGKECDNKKELDKKEDINNEYNLQLYKGYFTLNDFNFAIELKDIYSYFEGSECPYTKIKRRIIEIYGTLKNGVLVNSEMCHNNDDDDDNLVNSDADLKDLGIELNEDSFKIFMKDKYKYMHHSKLSSYRKKANPNKIVQKINKKTFMCLMYNIGIHRNHCLILWNNFIQFLEADLLDYKIFSAFLNGEINLSNIKTEENINCIKKKIMNNHLEDEEFSRNKKHRLEGTICPRLFKNNQKLYSTHALTFDEIEVLSKVLTNTNSFKYLDKNEKKQFISNLMKHCYKKGHTFESIKTGGNVKNKEKKRSENYMDKEIVILLNGILKNTKENNSFINSVNVIEKCNLNLYTAHTNVAIVEINDNMYTEEFVNLVNKKKEISNEFMSIVDNIPIFKNFPYDLKSHISMNVKKCEYQNKQFIIRQHDDPLDFYILKDGEVSIYYNNTDKDINTLSAYSFFGEISIIFNTLRTCNVAVKSDKAICYSISSEYFQSLLNKDMVKEFIAHSQINYNEESLNDVIITYMNNQIQNNSNIIKGNSISIPRLNVEPNASVNTSMSNNSKGISRDIVSNVTFSTTLSSDTIMLDTEYIDNKKYIRSFYSDLDKILLNNFNTEQKYMVEEIEANLMRVKVFKNILNKMEEKDKFVKNLKYEKCPKGKHLILEGDKCEKFYFIKQGAVSIRQFNQYKNMYDEITTFKDNQYFGHQLILSKEPSIFIVVTVCNTELYTIDANLYIQLLSPFIDILNKSKDINELDVLTESINNDAKIQKKDADFITKAIHFLKKVNIINKLNDDELYNSAKNFQFKFFKKGKVIIKYEDEPDFFYIIKKGIVSVKTDNGRKTISNENSLNSNSNIDSDKTNTTESQNEEPNMKKSVYLHKYEYFGELSIINNQLRTATCEAYTNCFLLAIDKISFSNYFSSIFNELLQEAEIKYTKNYSLPPWLKTIYGNDNNYDNMKSFASINLPKLDSSLSSISDRSSEEFDFEKDIKKKIKKAQKKEKEIKNNKMNKNKNKNDQMSEKDKVNIKTQNNKENSTNKKVNESANDISNSNNSSGLLCLTKENLDEKLKEIEKVKEKKLEEMKLKELKVFEKIKLRDEKKVERIMKKKNKHIHKKNDGVLKFNDNIENIDEKINKKKNDKLAKEKSAEVENNQISGKINSNDGNNPTTLIKVNVVKETHTENNNNNDAAEAKHILQTNQVVQKEVKDTLEPLNLPKKSSSILKIRTNSSSSTDLDVKDLIYKLTNYIESEYSSIHQFYESIDKFNRGYIKYEDFLNSMNSINIINKIFDKEEKIENVFKHLCNDMNILTPNNFYISIYKHKNIDKYELNLRLREIYSNSILGFKKNMVLKTVEDIVINYEDFENVCNQIGLIDKDNIQNIWNEINIMNEENIPLDIIINIINGELDIEESYEIYNNKKSLLNQVVNFFQGNNADLIKMSTNVMECNILTNYEDPVIINKAHHKSYPNECNYIVKQLELDPNFKMLTLDQRKYFATLMDRNVASSGEIITKQNSDSSPIMLLFEGTANLITYTIFGIETVVREIKNDEIYGSSEVIADSVSDYEVKINSNSAIIWTLKREHYNEKIKPMLEERQQNCIHILQVLKNVPILRYLPLEILDNISYSMKIEIHEPNHTIIKEGDYDDKFYIICKGLATVDIPSKYTCNKLIISSLKKADYFGELSLINNTARTANVVLDTTSILFSLVSSEFNRLLSPYFDKFTNRAKANYKKIQVENSLSHTDMQIYDINQNYTNSSIYNRNRKHKVTIQDSNYLKNIENKLKQNIPKQNELSESQNDDNKNNTEL
ncbi:hypothetical protein YYE_02086 [Plasmodium vinckei vinckei]|nr:hypothetical protein YYE_02086 [Plasmodium vinckei vinckei]